MSRSTLPVVFSTYSSFVPASATNFGSPSVTISSVGFVATTILGTLPDLSVGSVFASFGLPPGRKSTWPEAFASAIALSRSLPGFLTTSHSPSSAFAASQPSNTLTKCSSLSRSSSTRVLMTRSSFVSLTGW